MSTAVALITEQVRERVRRDGVDLGGDRQGALVDTYVREEVRRYSERALGGSLPMLHDEHQAAREIVASITGFGVLQPFFDDPEIEEIWINGPSKVFIARNGVPELTSVLLSDTEVRDLVERMLQSTGRRVDLSSPFVDASLPDGSRLHVVIPDTGNADYSVAAYSTAKPSSWMDFQASFVAPAVSDCRKNTHINVIVSVALSASRSSWNSAARE